MTDAEPMNTPNISTIDESQRSLTLAIMSASFIADPIMRWLFPSPETFLAVFDDFANAFGGRAIDHGTGFIVNDFCGAALWLPPGVESDSETMRQIIVENASPAALQDVEGFREQKENFHPHDDDCWYLSMIGVDAAHQGNGFGAVLMKHVLQEIDKRGCMAYLESSNPRNVSLYQRHGFEAVGSIQSGGSPTMTPMIRPRALVV
jgi:ribosomal protein S18 acetylase RimI-like enzyme